jgi:hypothetical protein
MRYAPTTKIIKKRPHDHDLSTQSPYLSQYFLDDLLGISS